MMLGFQFLVNILGSSGAEVQEAKKRPRGEMVSPWQWANRENVDVSTHISSASASLAQIPLVHVAAGHLSLAAALPVSAGRGSDRTMHNIYDSMKQPPRYVDACASSISVLVLTRSCLSILSQRWCPAPINFGSSSISDRARAQYKSAEGAKLAPDKAQHNS